MRDDRQLKKDNDYLKAALASAYFGEVLRESYLVGPYPELVLNLLNYKLNVYKEAALDDMYDHSSPALRRVFAKVVELIEWKINEVKTDD